MRLILARHGNTFAPGDRVVWVGRETDLSLVAAGEAQAHAAAAALARKGWRPDHLFCGPLRRTRVFAELIVADLGLPAPEIDDRLAEIDYGAWAGRTSAELEALGHGAALRAWNEADLWPEGAGWRSAESEIRTAVAGFIEHVTALDGTVLAVGSNGILRLVPRLLGLGDGRSWHMKTGRLAVLTYTEGRYAIDAWDIDPRSL